MKKLKITHKLSVKKKFNGIESFSEYRTFLGKHFGYASSYGLVFKLNKDESVDYLNPISRDDFYLDLLDAGMKTCEANFKKMIKSKSVKQITALNIIYSQLCYNKWDGNDRVSGLINAMNLKGNFDLNKRLITKWFCNCYALAFSNLDNNINYPVFSRVVFILHSDERAFGKTQFFRKIGMQDYLSDVIPNCDFSVYCEAQGELPKDEEKQYNFLTENLIFMVDDIDNLLINSGGTLRSIVSQTKITKRIYFTQDNRTYKRTASLAGTSNNSKLLRDATENRYMVFTLSEKMDFDFLNNLDVFQFWLQIQHLARESESNTNFTHDELNKIIELSQAYLYTSPLEDFVSENFSYDEGGDLLYENIVYRIKSSNVSYDDKKLKYALERIVPNGRLKRRVKRGDTTITLYRLKYGVEKEEPNLPF